MITENASITETMFTLIFLVAFIGSLWLVRYSQGDLDYLKERNIANGRRRLARGARRNAMAISYLMLTFLLTAVSSLFRPQASDNLDVVSFFVSLNFVGVALFLFANIWLDIRDRRADGRERRNKILRLRGHTGAPPIEAEAEARSAEQSDLSTGGKNER